MANNYGSPAGSAEETFGKILKDDFTPYRDELVVSSKAGWGMLPAPYADWGSKKYLMASLDQMALSWILKDKHISSVLIGVSKPEQIVDSIRCIENYAFSDEELNRINTILK